MRAPGRQVSGGVVAELGQREAGEAEHAPGHGPRGAARRALDPHRHEDVERAAVVGVAHDGGGGAVAEVELDLVLDLVGDVVQVARLEADLERVGAVFDAVGVELLGGRALLGAGGRQRQQVGARATS